MRVSALHEGGEDPVEILRHHADAGIPHHELYAILLPGRRLNPHEHTADIGEADGIADEIEQHLPDAPGLADQCFRQLRIHIAGKIDAASMSARAHHLADFLHQTIHGKGRGGRLFLVRLGARHVQNLVDDGQESTAGSLDGGRIVLLFRRQLRGAQQAGHADDAVHGRAQLVCDRGEKMQAAFRFRFRAVARFFQRIKRLFQFRHLPPLHAPAKKGRDQGIADEKCGSGQLQKVRHGLFLTPGEIDQQKGQQRGQEHARH